MATQADEDDDEDTPKIQFAPGMDLEDPVMRKYNLDAYDNDEDEPGRLLAPVLARSWPCC